VFDAGFLPTAWAYIGLGHIHKPQCLGGMPHVRYPAAWTGSTLPSAPMKKGWCCSTWGRPGLQGEPAWDSDSRNPDARCHVTDAAAELPALAEQYPDRKPPFVRIRVTHHPPARAGMRSLRTPAPVSPPCGTSLGSSRTPRLVSDGEGIQTAGRLPDHDSRFPDQGIGWRLGQADVLTLAEQFLTAEAAS